jgi:hypothetical protein
VKSVDYVSMLVLAASVGKFYATGAETVTRLFGLYTVEVVATNELIHSAWVLISLFGGAYLLYKLYTGEINKYLSIGAAGLYVAISSFVLIATTTVSEVNLYTPRATYTNYDHPEIAWFFWLLTVGILMGAIVNYLWESYKDGKVKTPVERREEGEDGVVQG